MEVELNVLRTAVSSGFQNKQQQNTMEATGVTGAEWWVNCDNCIIGKNCTCLNDVVSECLRLSHYLLHQIRLQGNQTEIPVDCVPWSPVYARTLEYEAPHHINLKHHLPTPQHKARNGNALNLNHLHYFPHRNRTRWRLISHLPSAIQYHPLLNTVLVKMKDVDSVPMVPLASVYQILSLLCNQISLSLSLKHILKLFVVVEYEDRRLIMLRLWTN